MMQFLFPAGLISLASLAAVLALYFYVFRGRRVTVSALFLWGAGKSLRAEGRKWRRPPATWPLVLELLAALLLSLTVAELVHARTSHRRHAVVVLDSSASMNAGTAEDSFRERARSRVRELCGILGEDGRVSLVSSGYGGRLFGGGPLTADEADALLATWRPGDSPHSFAPAIELGRSVLGEHGKVVLVTDHAVAAPGAVAIGVGGPIENTGWVAAHWMSESELFALVKHFGKSKSATTVTVQGDGVELARMPVSFEGRDAVPLVFKVPPNVRTIAATLPRDGLANDDVLRVTRPAPATVRVRADVSPALLAERLLGALAATGKARVVAAQEDAPLAFAMEPPAPAPASPRTFEVRFHAVAAKDARAYLGPYFVNEFHPILRGVDLHGVIWAADEKFRADGTVLASVGDVPLIVLDGDRLTLNLVAERTNLFQALAWPVLISNVVDAVYDRSPGLKRFSFRLGESLSFARPPEWQGEVEIAAPDGRRTGFKFLPRVYYGRLETDGIHEVFAGGAKAAAIDVNLLADEESDLTGAASFGSLSEVKAALLPESRRRPFHRELALVAAAALIGCWFLLERGKV